MAAAEDWNEDDLFALVRRAYRYRDLTRSDFDAVIDMLSEGISTKRGRSGAFLHRDRVNGVVRGRRGARLAAITSGGAIPDNAQFLVVAEPDETSSARSTKISRSRAWPATCSCSARRPGASAASRPAACASKTRTARRRRFRSGAAKRPAARGSCRRRCRICDEDPRASEKGHGPCSRRSSS